MSSNTGMNPCEQNQWPQILKFKQKGMSFDLSERYHYKESLDIKRMGMLIQGLKPVELDAVSNPLLN